MSARKPRRWDGHHPGQRFADSDVDPLGGLANLADLMLVFACGLMVSLAAHHGLFNGQPAKVTRVEKGQVLAAMPAKADGAQGSGLQAVGQVYRDANSGKLLLVEP